MKENKIEYTKFIKIRRGQLELPIIEMINKLHLVVGDDYRVKVKHVKDRWYTITMTHEW